MEERKDVTAASTDEKHEGSNNTGQIADRPWSEDRIKDYLHTKRRYKLYKCKVLDHKGERYWWIPDDIIEKVTELKKFVANDLDTEEYNDEEYYLDELDNITNDIKEMYENEIIPELLGEPRPVQYEFFNDNDKPKWQFEDIDPDDWKYNDTYESKISIVCVNEEGEMTCRHNSSIYFPEDEYVEFLSHIMSRSFYHSDYYTFNDLSIDKPELARGITCCSKRILGPLYEFDSFIVLMTGIKQEARELLGVDD